MDNTQQLIWSKEHQSPSSFKKIHSESPSEPVIDFGQFLNSVSLTANNTRILDIGCGKGRNSLYLAQNCFAVTGVDFIESAVKEAKLRAKNLKLKANFSTLDITQSWPFADNSFNALIDCNTTICVPDPDRSQAIAEIYRCLSPNGYYLFYGVGPTDLLKTNPGPEKNSCFFPKSGKFEKQYSRSELISSYKNFGFKLIKIDELIKEAEIEGKMIKFPVWVAIFKKN